MGMILAAAEGFGVDDYLMLGIDEGLAVVALDDAMGGLHLGRLVVRYVRKILSLFLAPGSGSRTTGSIPGRGKQI